MNNDKTFRASMIFSTFSNYDTFSIYHLFDYFED